MNIITKEQLEKTITVKKGVEVVRSDKLALIFERTHKQVLALIRENLNNFEFIEEIAITTKGKKYKRYYCPIDFVKWYEVSAKPNKKSNLLYLLTDGTYHKIGITQQGELKKRIRVLQTGNPNKIYEVFSINHENAYKIETLLHKIYANKSMMGEWFNLTKDDVDKIKLEMRDV